MAGAGSAPAAQLGGSGEARLPGCQPAEQLAGRLAAACLADVPGSGCTGAPLGLDAPEPVQPPRDGVAGAPGSAGTRAAGLPCSPRSPEGAGPAGARACAPHGEEGGGAAPGVSAHEALMRSAARAWGRQLDARSSGAGARQRGLARGGMLGGRMPDSLPAALPWVPGGTPRFACDANLEGLARQLRMCGLDATSAPPGGANKQRFLIHRWLVEMAEREARLVLTTDRAFIAARHTGACLLVTAPDKKAQLAQVLGF